MSNITNNTDNREQFPGQLPEQFGRRAEVLTIAAGMLKLREFTMAEASQPVNESPVIDKNMTPQQQRARIQNLQEFVPSEPAPSAPVSHDEYLNALTSDVPHSADAARAKLADVFAEEGNY